MFLYSINSIVVEKQYSDDLYYKNQILSIFELLCSLNTKMNALMLFVFSGIGEINNNI